jgi:hypothetical protein
LYLRHAVTVTVIALFANQVPAAHISLLFMQIDIDDGQKIQTKQIFNARPSV